jgi:transcriptional regulator
VAYERDCAMTLDEIAAELGTSKKNIAATLHAALKKIRRRPQAVRQFRELVEMRRQIRERGMDA